MISCLLLPDFASGAPCDVFLRALISAHPSQADHIQGTVGLPVATAVETVPEDLAGGGFDGSDPAQTGEGGLGPQPLGVVPGRDQERRGVVGTAMPGKERSSGATCPTSRSSCASSSAISAERAS